MVPHEKAQKVRGESQTVTSFPLESDGVGSSGQTSGRHTIILGMSHKWSGIRAGANTNPQRKSKPTIYAEIILTEQIQERPE